MRIRRTYIWGAMVLGVCAVDGMAAAEQSKISTTEMRSITVNGENTAAQALPILKQTDTIEFKYICKAPTAQQMPFLFSITLASEKSQLKRTESLNASSVKYTRLPEGEYMFSVHSYVPGQWKTEPVTARFAVDNNNAQEWNRRKSASKPAAVDSLIKPLDSVSAKQTGFISTPYMLGSGAVVLIIAFVGVGLYWKNNKKQMANASNNYQPSQEVIMQPTDTRQLEELQSENVQLRTEIAALRGQIDALQSRSEELYKQNKDLEKSMLRINEKKQEIEELQEQKDEIFAMLIHDIKNPAGLIKGLVELLRSYDLTATEQHDVMNDLLETSKKIVSLSQEVCKVMALESSALNLHIEENDVSEILRSVAARNEGSAVLKAMNVVLDVPDNLPTAAFDANRIEEVVDNLVNNAIKYSHRGGMVRIRARKDAEGIVIEITDNGLGLSEEDLKKAFQRGARLSARPTAGEPSSGLGLWIVKRVVEQHKGRVWVKSAVGKGSTFAFVLPMSS